MTTERFTTNSGHIARAMALVHEHHESGAEVSGTIKCPKCSSSLRYSVDGSGRSRGHCSAGCGVRWETL